MLPTSMVWAKTQSSPLLFHLLIMFFFEAVMPSGLIPCLMKGTNPNLLSLIASMFRFFNASMFKGLLW